MGKEERKEAIRKSISLIGWMSTSARIQTKEDREIFDELARKEKMAANAKDDVKLKRHGISF